MSKAIMLEREPRVVRGELAAVPGQDVRKIGEVARIDYLFRKLVLTSTVVAVMQELMSPHLKPFRADVLMKSAGVGSAKGIH